MFKYLEPASVFPPYETSLSEESRHYHEMRRVILRIREAKRNNEKSIWFRFLKFTQDEQTELESKGYKIVHEKKWFDSCGYSELIDHTTIYFA